MALTQTVANALLTYLHGGAAPTALTTPVRCRFMTANGSATAAGTEVATGGGYTSGTSAPSTSWSAVSAQAQATSAAISVTNYPRAETVVGIELWDSSPARQEFGTLTTPKTMAAGDTLTIPAGSLTSSMT